MRRSWWSAGVALHAALLAGYLVVAVTQAGSAEARSTLSCVLMLEAALFAGWSAVRTAARIGVPRARLPWRLLATGCFGWACAQLWWTYLEVFEADPPFLLTATGIGYAALPVLALPALRLLVSDRPVGHRSAYGWAPRLLDVLALSGGVLVLGWQLTLDSATSQDRVFPLVYSVGDIAIVIAVLALLVRHAGAVQRPLQLAAAGLVLVAGTDFTYVGQALDDAYVTGTWLDAGWLGGFLLLSAGAGSARRPPSVRPMSQAGRRLQILLPNVPVALAVGVAGYGFVHGRSGSVVLSLALAVVLVASLRQALTLSQNSDLLEELAVRQVDLRRQALEDPLTGLANRTSLVERLDAALLDRDAAPVSLLYLDLDDFKLINDTHGHDAGDHVLVELGRRLAALVGPLDTVARLGGDEFAVLLRGSDAEVVACMLLAALQQPVHVGARRFVVNGSIGLVRAEAPAETAGTLLSHADIAMYTAKGAGKGRVAAMHGLDRSEAVRKTRMRELVAHPRLEHFTVVYQPVVDLADGRMRGVEALVRWTDPEIGPVPPDEFIHLAEQAGSIGAIGRHVLQTALRDLSGWQREFPQLRMAVGVNLSPVQLGDGDLIAMAQQALDAGGLDTDQLVLEITEEALVGDIEQAARVVHDLRQAGISVAIDDFGTGYSSFRYLDRFEADVLKIDRSFVAKVSSNDRTRELVRSVSELGRVLDLQTIAEGVETLADLQVLRQLGVQLAQGFLFSRPVPAERITELLAGGGCFSFSDSVPAPRPGGTVLHIA